MLQLGNTAAGHHLVPAVAGNKWMLPPPCDACASSPASLFCKADSASLCEACDTEIHSANPLARRHHRAAIVPGVNYGVVADSGLNPVKSDVDSLSYGNEIDIDPTSFCGVVDQYLDLGDYDHQFNNINHNYNINNIYNNNNNNNIDRSGGCDDDSSIGGYNYSATLSHTVSFSKLDVGVVPEQSTTMSENSSISHTRPPRGDIGLLAGPLVEMPAQLSVMDREARVLRYREKKKARKFEKTIRYASRKAYAESRPRIKGRFARKGSVAEFEVDHLFSASLMADAGAAGFGIVPSFEV